MRWLRQLLYFPIAGLITGTIYGVKVSRNPLAWIPYLLLLPVFVVLIPIVRIVSIPISFILMTCFRARCPHCSRRGLSGGRVVGDPSLHEGDDRDFHWSECRYCHNQFHHFDDRSWIHIPPTDSRYVRPT